MNLFTALRQRRERARVIDTLRRLDDHILRDMGFERDQLGLIGRDGIARLQGLGR